MSTETDAFKRGWLAGFTAGVAESQPSQPKFLRPSMDDYIKQKIAESGIPTVDFNRKVAYPAEGGA